MYHIVMGITPRAGNTKVVITNVRKIECTPRKSRFMCILKQYGNKSRRISAKSIRLPGMRRALHVASNGHVVKHLVNANCILHIENVLLSCTNGKRKN